MTRLHVQLAAMVAMLCLAAAPFLLPPFTITLMNYIGVYSLVAIGLALLTGVGGIVRDIISMGARPVGVMDPLRFGAIDHPDTQRVLPGVVSGIGGYGNSLGLPNVGGEVVFDEVYQQNPLVNALAVGVMRHEDIRLANASGVGN